MYKYVTKEKCIVSIICENVTEKQMSTTPPVLHKTRELIKNVTNTTPQNNKSKKTIHMPMA